MPASGLGRRGILLTKYDHQLPAKLPDTVRHFGFVPLSKLLPRTAALVHHGGIGSCAQGLAAGVPHVVRPMSYDQFDNSRRLVRLGVAKEISVAKVYRARTWRQRSHRCWSSPTVAASLPRTGDPLRRPSVARRGMRCARAIGEGEGCKIVRCKR